MDEQVRIATLILANHVEVANGLLYISGGGWTDQHRRIPPGGPVPISHFGIGITVEVPWNATNQNHPFVVRVEDDDAKTVVVNAEGHLTVGRPPNISPGSKQFAVIGLVFDTIFQQEGGHRVVARVGEKGEEVTWPFRVHNVPG